MKRPLRAILSSIFALFKDAKSTKRPFRARLSPFLASAGHEKAVPCDAVAIFGLPKTRNCRFPRNGLRFLLFQDKKRPFRSRLSSFFALQSTKKAVPCDTVAIFSLKKPFRAILSHFSAKNSRSVRYCRNFQPKKAVPCDTVAFFQLSGSPGKPRESRFRRIVLRPRVWTLGYLTFIAALTAAMFVTQVC